MQEYLKNHLDHIVIHRLRTNQPLTATDLLGLEQTLVEIPLRYKAITKRLNTDFWETDSDTSHSLYVGSYGRNTAIPGTSDVDMIFQLPSSVYKQYDDYTGNGQSALLQAVRTSVKKTYSVTNIGWSGYCVSRSANAENVTGRPRIRSYAGDSGTGHRWTVLLVMPASM